MTELRTPDGRYIVVRGRLWRTTNPNISETERERLVKHLMDARRRFARRTSNFRHRRDVMWMLPNML